MPTYDYRCKKCGHKMAAFQSITEDPLTTCPKCGEESLQRLIGAGAGIIFKGSGFYETDYKRSRSGNGGKPKKPEKGDDSAKSSDSSSKGKDSKKAD